MPVDVPSLPEVDPRHFVVLDLVASELFCRRDVVVQLQNWPEVHEVSCIYGNVYAKLLVGAQVTTTLFAPVLYVVDHQTSVVNDFSKTTAVVDVFVLLEVLQISPSKTAGHDETKSRSPTLATPIEQVIDGSVDSFVDCIDVCKLEGRCFGNFTAAATVFERARVGGLEVFPVCEFSRNDLLDDLAVLEELPVLFQVWDGVLLFSTEGELGLICQLWLPQLCLK